MPYWPPDSTFWWVKNEEVGGRQDGGRGAAGGGRRDLRRACRLSGIRILLHPLSVAAVSSGARGPSPPCCAATAAAGNTTPTGELDEIDLPNTVDVINIKKPFILSQWMGMNTLIDYVLAASMVQVNKHLSVKESKKAVQVIGYGVEISRRVRQYKTWRIFSQVTWVQKTNSDQQNSPL